MELIAVLLIIALVCVAAPIPYGGIVALVAVVLALVFAVRLYRTHRGGPVI